MSMNYSFNRFNGGVGMVKEAEQEGSTVEGLISPSFMACRKSYVAIVGI
jgi:hypothetical protein